MKTWTSVITYSVLDIGRECETKEEYIEWVKQSFQEEHNIELTDNEISDIEYEENEDEDILSESDFSQLEEQKYHVEENEDE